ncbi:MAG: hypothetical protein ACKO24_04655 [Leptolyngbyaceae cyanobacterium]
MELANPTYPMRSVIRCQAKQQILSTGDSRMAFLDQTLFQELASTLFNSAYFQSLYRAYPSTQERCAVEDRLAVELAAIYHHVTQRRQQPLVQQLNALLLVEPAAEGE